MSSNRTSKGTLALLLAVLAGSVVACGDDDRSSDEPSASQTRNGTSATTPSGGAPSDRDRAGTAPSGETSAGGTSSNSGSGGSRAPRAERAPRKKSLQRYLAKNYRQTPWYPLMRKLEIAGGHVTVYLTFPPESDDEGPPVLACTAVLSYGSRVKKVTVYGSATPQGKSVPIKAC